MATQDNIPLSPSEKLTLRYVADSELHASELDWIALQRLKQAGLLQVVLRPIAGAAPRH